MLTTTMMIKIGNRRCLEDQRDVDDDDDGDNDDGDDGDDDGGRR